MRGRGGGRKGGREGEEQRKGKGSKRVYKLYLCFQNKVNPIFRKKKMQREEKGWGWRRK